MRVAAIQSSYIPWKGYFDLVRDVDLFVFYDCVQFTRQDWRSRNRIKTADGVQWLSVPTGSRIDRLVNEVELTDGRWQRRHWRTLTQSYSRSQYFSRYESLLAPIYLDCCWRNLSDLNQTLTKLLASTVLGIKTRFVDSRSYQLEGRRMDRLIDLVVKTGATSYVSGPAAASYIEPDRFDEIGVELRYKDYSGYPEYPQLYPPFEHHVSLLDLIFNTGPRAADYIWGWR